MRAYNTNHKDRHSVTLRDFRGVDYSTTPVRVATNHATEMSNFIFRDGVNQKRHGWEEMLHFEYDGFAYVEKVLQVGEYVLVGVNESYTYREDLYRCTYDEIEEKYTLVLVYTYATSIIPTQQKFVTSYGVQVFKKNNKSYIVGNGKILVDDGKIVKEVEPYIPTTTININDALTPSDVRATLDAVNRLTTFRKNTLVGKNDSAGEWQLDSTNINEVGVEIDITIASGTIHLKSDSVGSLYNDDGEYKGQVKPNGEINIANQNTKPIIAGTSNIVVTFDVNDIPKENQGLGYIRFGTLFGTNGNSNRLFIAGSKVKTSTIPTTYYDFNRIYYSDIDNFDYFPDINTIDLGSNSRISGFMRLKDNTLAVFMDNEQNSNEANIYYLSGQDRVTYDDKGNIKAIYSYFPAIGSTIAETPIRPNACFNFGNENLIMSKNGLFALELTQNLKTDERRQYNRSYYINDRIRPLMEEYGNRFGYIIDNGYLYITFGNGEVFVANQDHKSLDPINGTPQYEWWHFDNVPAECLGKLRGEIVFASKRAITKISENYADIIKDNIPVGSVMANINTDTITIDWSLNLDISDGDNITFGTGLYKLLCKGATTKDGLVYTTPEEIFNIHEGMNVEVNGRRNVVLSVNYAECTFILRDNIRDGEIFDVKLSLEVRKLIIVDYNADNSHFKVKEQPDLPTIRLTDKNGTGIEGLTATLIHYEPVVAKWYTAVMDLGTNEVSKTLLKTTIATEKIARSSINYGYNTRHLESLLKAKGTGKFDFNDMSFEDFTFETGFASAYTQLVKVRNFNYIMFRFISDNDRNCAVNDFTITYKYNKNNKGVN